MLTPARIDCLRQIKKAGYAMLGHCGWMVNGWRGKGPTEHGPSKPMMDALIDGAFLSFIESPNRYFRAVGLTPFGEVAVLNDEPAAALIAAKESSK